MFNHQQQGIECRPTQCRNFTTIRICIGAIIYHRYNDRLNAIAKHVLGIKKYKWIK
jgi:hypothetical protein